MANGHQRHNFAARDTYDARRCRCRSGGAVGILPAAAADMAADDDGGPMSVFLRMTTPHQLGYCGRAYSMSAWSVVLFDDAMKFRDFRGHVSGDAVKRRPVSPRRQGTMSMPPFQHD